MKLALVIFDFGLFVFNSDMSSGTLRIPEYVDWVERGAVTPVKNQGYCFSSYAFATTGLLEAFNWKKTGRLVPLSEQNLIDCDGNQGCKGGSVRASLEYVLKNQGINTEQSYRYQGKSGTCRFHSNRIGGKLTNFQIVRSGNETLIKQLVANGPVVTIINSNQENFRYYRNGIYYNSDCGKRVNHAVLIVGYGSINGVKYWKVKNSWGTRWGIKGYILMARNRNNNCDNASLVYSASVK